MRKQFHFEIIGIKRKGLFICRNIKKKVSLLRFLKVFGIGFLLFVVLIMGLLMDTNDPSTRDGIGFLIIFGVIIYLPILFIVAVAAQFDEKGKG